LPLEDYEIYKIFSQRFFSPRKGKKSLLSCQVLTAVGGKVRDVLNWFPRIFTQTQLHRRVSLCPCVFVCL